MENHSAQPVLRHNSGKSDFRERVWKIFGIIFYIIVAVGAIYHLVLPYFFPR